MKVYLETLGCRLNLSEMETLGRRLAAAGHQLVESPEQADVCVLNTCAVTGEAARKSRQLARRLARANPETRLALTGCYATLAPDLVASLPNVALVVDNRDKDILHELLQPWSRELDGESYRRLAPESTPYRPSRTRAFVKVQDGCNNRCTFCIVTVARGQERSRPIAELVAEVQQLRAEGLQEVVLTGVHLGGYGSDLGSSLHDLVVALLRHSDLPRLRLSSLEPWDLAPQFFDLWPLSQGRLCPHLHLPLQAGCDRTLRRMGRRSNTADFHSLVAAARARIPDLVLTTDIICGFPGESEADFQESLRFVEAMGFGHVHVFPYSPRPDTAAAAFAGQVPVEERRRRVAAMQALARRSGHGVRRGFLGQVRPVLWEERESQPENGRAAWTGLTDNYLRVRTMVDASASLANRITPARLLSLNGTALEAEIPATVSSARAGRP
jgi:threonylcarbamoyladenosine tRNA methylthiotransferase MtaB